MITALIRRIRRSMPKFDLDAPCPAVMNAYWPQHPKLRPTCERDIGHPGLHWCVYVQVNSAGDYDALYEWNRSGGLGQSVKNGLYLCDVCGSPELIGKDCGYCTSWSEIEMLQHTDENLVIADGTLYRWGKPGDNGAFAGTAFTVHMNDGRTLGPDSRLWYKSDVPHEWLPRIPDNARLERMPYSVKARWQQ